MTHSDAQITGHDLIEFIRHPGGLTKVPLRRWDTLLRVAKRANLLGRLTAQIRRANIEDQLPHQVRHHLDSAHVLTMHQREAIAWEARHIGNALSSLGTTVILLKGTAYAMTQLEAANGRLFGDVDILVPSSEIAAVEAALMLHGWASGHHDAYDDRYYRQWMHEIPPMSHCARGTVIDVHHNILPTTARNCPDASLLMQNCQPIAGTVFSTLSPVNMVIHSATHLFHESELQNGLRDLFDLDSLLGEFSQKSDTFWPDLGQSAKLLGLALPLYLALRCARAVLGTKIPEEAMLELEAETNRGKFSLSVLDAVYFRALMPDHPASAKASHNLARAWVYVRGHYLRMPPTLLAWHLGRKSVLRLFRNTSRTN